MSALNLPYTALARRVVVTYAIFSGLWIALSDRLLQRFANRLSELTDLQTMKGCLFVIVTSGLLYGLIQQSSRSLQKSYSLLSSILDNTTDPIFAKDCQGCYVMANPAVTELLGRSMDEILGRRDADFFPPDIAQSLVETDRRVLRTGQPVTVEETVLVRGELKLYLSTKTAWRDRCGQVTGLVGIGRDISQRKQVEERLRASEARYRELSATLEERVQQRTVELQQRQTQLEQEIVERQRAEAALQQLNQNLTAEVLERRAAERKLEQLTAELQRSNQELEQFASVASHDLQEPLRAIEGFTRLLNQEYHDQLDETAQTYIGFVVDATTRMRRLIQDLLAYSRVGTRSQEWVETDCNAVLAEALENLHVALSETQAVIAAESLPTLQADPVQLVQLWQNLVANALKFKREIPPRIEISATLVSADDPAIAAHLQSQLILSSEPPDVPLWLFRVQDNGIGIKAKYLERIFVIFKRLHTRQEYEGTGIGLAICRKIVERQGGQIWAESELGVGTTIYFTLLANRDSNLGHPSNT